LGVFSLRVYTPSSLPQSTRTTARIPPIPNTMKEQKQWHHLSTGPAATPVLNLKV
jgi:hypothetical protein